MAGSTNRGKYNLLALMRGAALPTNFYIALCSAAVDADDDTFSDATEVAAGQGYTSGGIAITPNATDFDVLTEDDVNDRAYIRIKDITWTGSGGTLPSSGSATYAVMTDDNASQPAREIWFYWDLGGSFSVSDGQDLTLVDLEIRINE